MNRRALLAAAGLAAVPALSACQAQKPAARPTPTATPAPPPPTPTPGPVLDRFGGFRPAVDPASGVSEDQLARIAAALATSDLYVGSRNNLAFVLTDANGQPLAGADQASATFYDLTDPQNPRAVYSVKALPGVPAGIAPAAGAAAAQAYYTPVTFDHAGNWGVLVQATLADGTKGAASFGVQVLAKSRIPAPGQPAPPSANLTRRDVTDISQLDSGDPPDDMHDVRIKDSLAAGRPFAVVFASPAHCAAPFCGSPAAEVAALQRDYRVNVDFIHIEIWRDFASKALNPTAREWLLHPDGTLTEPVVYVAGRNGIIYDRWEGPVTRSIVEPAVKAVSAGEVWTA